MKKFVLFPEVIYKQVMGDINASDREENLRENKVKQQTHNEQLPCYGVPDRYRKRAQDLSAYLMQIPSEEIDGGEDGCVTLRNNSLKNSNIFDYIS